MALSRGEIARRKVLGARRAEVAHLIKYEMKRRGHTGESFAKLLGCSGQNVSVTICGYGHSKLVLDGLRAIGVPEDLLYDPRRGRYV
jgi:predicted transcriptional regulator